MGSGEEFHNFFAGIEDVDHKMIVLEHCDGETRLRANCDINPGDTLFTEKTCWFCPINTNLRIGDDPGDLLTIDHVFQNYDEDVHGFCSVGIMAFMMAEKGYVPPGFKNAPTTHRCPMEECKLPKNMFGIHEFLEKKCKLVRSILSGTHLSVSYFPLASLAKHSCESNCELVLDYNFVRMVAVKPIKKGDLLNVNYLLNDLGGKVTSFLFKELGQECKCSYCLSCTNSGFPPISPKGARGREFKTIRDYQDEFVEFYAHSKKKQNVDANLFGAFTQFIAGAHETQELINVELDLCELVKDSSLFTIDPELPPLDCSDSPRFVDELLEKSLLPRLRLSIMTISESPEYLRVWVLLLSECCRQLLRIGHSDAFMNIYHYLVELQQYSNAQNSSGFLIFRPSDLLLKTTLDLCVSLLSTKETMDPKIEDTIVKQHRNIVRSKVHITSDPLINRIRQAHTSNKTPITPDN